MFSIKDLIIGILLFFIVLYLYLAKNEPCKQLSVAPREIVLQGLPYLIDGDSIRVSGVEIRLKGIDAPELLQTCGDAEHKYLCGQEAKAHLDRLIANRVIDCNYTKLDIYHRALALCFVGNVLLNKQMIRDGWAVSFYDYTKEQKIARLEKLGLWRAPFELPKYWRRNHKHAERPLANPHL